MARIVLDPSFAVRWALLDEQDAEADALLQRALAGQDELVVPPHFYAEAFSAFYQALRESRITEAEAFQALDLLSGVPLTVGEPIGLYETALRLGIHYDVSGGQTFDLVYLALAELLDVPLWTGDARFYRSLRPAPSRLRLFPSTRLPR